MNRMDKLISDVFLGLGFILSMAAMRRDGTLRRLLVLPISTHVSANPKTVRNVRSTDIQVDPSRGVWFRLYLPEIPARDLLPVVVFFHGGGFAFYSAGFFTYDVFCRRLCHKLSAAVVSVNYRLSPEHPFPAPYEDGVNVLRFIDSAKSTTADPLLKEFLSTAELSMCFVAGDSAGGNIAHHVTRLFAEGGQGSKVKLAGLILIQPFFGGERRVPSEIQPKKVWSTVPISATDWMWKAFLPKGATRDHLAANPVASTDNLDEGFPPVIIMAGEYDPLLDWQRMYYENLQRNGKRAQLMVYDKAYHSSYILPRIPGTKEMIADMLRFVEHQISRLQLN